MAFFIAFALAVLMPFLSFQAGVPHELSASVLLAWGVSLVVFTLSTLLAGAIEEGLWAGYLNLSVMVIWLILGLPAALLLVFAGVGLAAVLRQHSMIVPTKPVKLRRTTLESAAGRVTISGASLIAAAAIYNLLGGTSPLTESSLNYLPTGVALIAAFVLSQAFGHLLSVGDSSPKFLFARSQRGRLINELLLLALIVPLVLIYREVGALVFTVLMGLVAAQVIRYYQVSYVQERLMQRVRELSLLNGIGQNISANLVMDDVLEGVYEWVTQLVDLTSFSIALYDQHHDVVDFRFVIKDGRRVQRSTCRVPDDPLIEQVIRNRAVVRLEGERASHVSIAPLPADGRVQFCLSVPLMTGSKLIGVMTIFSRHQATNPEKVELKTLETVANQASLAIRNATLYDRTVNLAQNLAYINRSVQDVMFNFDGDDAIRAACETAMQISQAQKCAIFLLDRDDKSQSRLVQSIGLTEAHRRLYDGPVHLPNIIGSEPRVVSDVMDVDERDALAELARAGVFRALAEIPLRSGNTPVGLLTVFHDSPHYYHDTELELLETLAYQVTAALDNSELLSALELYASEQAQLVHLSRISTSSLELERVIESVSQMLQQMMNVDHVYVGLLLPGNTQIQLYEQNSPDQIPLPVDAIPELATLRSQYQPGPRVYYRHEDMTSNELAAFMDERGDAMVALVPMVADNSLLGVVVLGDLDIHYFSDGEWRLLEMATNQIATQLHNAQLYRHTQEELKRRLQQLALIEDIAQQISSTLNLEQLIRNVLQGAILAAQAEIAVIGLLTGPDELRVIGQEYIDGEWVEGELTRKSDEGLLGRVAHTGETLVVPDNALMPEYISEQSHRTYRSSLVVPLIAEGTIIGALNVESLQPDFFNQERIRFIKNLAGHAVISIQNARLLHERQKRIEMLTELRELSLRLSSDTDMQSVVTAVLQASLNMLRARNAVLFRYQVETDDLAVLDSMWREGETYVRASSSIPEPIVYRAAHTGEMQVVEDVRESEFSEDFADASYRSLIVAPIKRGNQVREVLCITLPRSRPYLENDLNTVGLLVIQIAGHLENAALYEHIRTNSNRMRAILDTTRDGIILLDRMGRLIEANLSAEELLSINLQDYYNQNFADTLMASIQEDDTQTQGSLREALTDMARILRLEPERITSRSWEIHRGSQIRYVEEVGSPVVDSENQIMGRLLTLRNVTEERLLANYRDEISSMVVHDLRGPLGSIISSITLTLEILEEEQQNAALSETVMPLLEVSLDSAVSLLQLVDSLLDIAKLETRRMPLRRTPTSVPALVNSAFLTLLTSAQEARIEVEQDIPQDLPPVNVDSDKIRRVLINLLDNAVRYTPSGGRILIKASIVGRKKVLVRVSDSGSGIPAGEAESVFDKFRQVKGNLPLHGRKGTGLGLTFCRLAVEAHGETIWVEPNGPLPGACFAFTLPVVSSDQQEESLSTTSTPTSL